MKDPERFFLPEDVEALYETDIGPIDIAGPGAGFETGRKTQEQRRNSMDLFVSPGEGSKDSTGKAQKGKYDEDGIDEESYASGFGLQVSGAHFDEKEKSLKIEYKLLPGKGIQKAAEMDSAAWHEMNPTPPQDVQKNEDLMLANAAERAAYSGGLSIEKYTQSVLGSELSATYDSGVLNIEYKNVELINGQKTYQRIVLKAESDGESVYDLTMRKFSDAGIEASAEYDGEFGSMIFTSMNGRAEGAGGNFNEFYVNGEIGGSSADKQKLKKDDYIEWRNAEETDGSCGGSPDFESIKSALEYSTVAMVQAQHMGLLAQRPYSSLFQGFPGGFILH